MKYTVQFFIDKFEKIPEEYWNTNTYGYNTSHCAGGHCGMRSAGDAEKFPEAMALLQILIPTKIKRHYYTVPFLQVVAIINDGEHPKYKQPTPRARILAALYDIKAMQQQAIEQYPDLTRQLAVLPSDRREVDVVKEPLKTLI